MDMWKTEILKTAQFVIGNPGSMVEGLVIAALAIMAFVLVLGLVGGIFGCAMTETGRTITVLFITVLAVIGGGAIGTVLVAPNVASQAIQLAAPWVTAALLVLALAVPAGCFLLKGKYGQTLLSILVGMASFAVVVAIIHTGFNAARAGGQNIEKAKELQQERTQRIR